MEKIITSINLLDAVLADLDKIPVEGFENQKKFVNCGTAIETVVTTLAAFLKKAESAMEEERKAVPVTKVNGTEPMVENIDTEVEADG